MELVIEIDKKAFDYIMACSFVEDEAVMLNQSLEDRIKTLMFFDVLNAIKSGTPLPKGHGDLISKEQAIELVEFYQLNPQHFDFVNLIDEIKDEKPIIEVDKED